MNSTFSLTNEQRKYLGLKPIEAHWEEMNIKGTLYYFDGDVIRKEISTADYHEETFRYREYELDVQTAENKTIVLPKTKKGKSKKLNFTATQAFHPVGVYFSYESRSVSIASFTTQKTFHREKLKDGDASKALESWLDKWIAETSEADIAELEIFKNEKRVHQKYKEGDIFAFKIGRRQYGFGKILIDIVKRRKTEEFRQAKNYGLSQLMGTALIVKVYHMISDHIDIDLDVLEKGLSLPAQAMMDNCIYYNEFRVIGNRQVTNKDLDDAPISTSRSINWQDKDIAYLQYGLIYKEMTLHAYEIYEDERWYYKDYRNERIGGSLNIDKLEACIATASNEPFYKDTRGEGLNHPVHKKDKNAIFKIFGLDGDLDYEGNLELYRNYVEEMEKN